MRTSQPPRTAIYGIEQELTAPTKGGFLMPRLTTRAWTSRRVSVYNADYSTDGTRLLQLAKPWTVLTPIDFRAFTTHAEALEYAAEKARK